MEIDLKAIKETGKVIGKIGKYTALAITAPLFIPSRIRRIYDWGTKNDDEQFASMAIIPMIPVHLANLMISIKHYNSNPELYSAMIATPIATNILSGIYEIYRYQLNKNKTPVTSSPTPEIKPSELEVKATEAPKIESQQEKPINPWDTEIPTFKETMLEGRR